MSIINTNFQISKRSPDRTVEERVFIELCGSDYKKIHIEAVELTSGEIIVRVSGETRVALASNISTMTPEDFYRREMNG